MFRRAFLVYGLMLVGFSRRVWAQLTTASPGYTRLTRSVRIPLESVKALWSPSPFVAEALVPETMASSSRPAGQRVVLNGVLFRKSAGDGASGLSALCVTCPHEQCEARLVTDQEKLAKYSEGVTPHPLFICGCHTSVFDAADDGSWIAGPAPRGMFRFRVGGVSDGAVEIIEIEEEAFSAV